MATEAYAVIVRKDGKMYKAVPVVEMEAGRVNNHICTSISAESVVKFLRKLDNKLRRCTEVIYHESALA